MDDDPYITPAAALSRSFSVNEAAGGANLKPGANTSSSGEWSGKANWSSGGGSGDDWSKQPAAAASRLNRSVSMPAGTALHLP